MSEASLQASEAPSLVMKMDARDILFMIQLLRMRAHACVALLGNLCNLYNPLIENQLSYLPVLRWIHGLGELVAN